MATITNPVVPRGSTVLVTGANSFVGSHIADQFLRNGYKVRATVRDPSKESWAVDVFGKLYCEANFELVAVPEMAVDGAFDEVVKGVSIVVHTATYIFFTNDASEVVPVSIAGALNALKAAYAEPSVKRFVYTSSSSAVLGPDFDGVTITEDSWNEDAVKRAWAPPPYEPGRPALIYEASKTQAEQEVWKFHRENRSMRADLIINTVLPSLTFGRCIDPVGQGYRSSSKAMADLWDKKENIIHDLFPPEFYVDVEDVALLHVAAGLLPHVQDQRIFGFAGPWSWDRSLEIMRELDPKRELRENFSDGTNTCTIVPAAKVEKLLQELGRPGWKSLRDSIAENVKDA